MVTDALDGGSSSQSDDILHKDENTLDPSELSVTAMGDSTPKSPSDLASGDHFKARAKSISLLSAELQKATRSETLAEEFEHATRGEGLHPLEQDVVVEDKALDLSATSWSKDRSSHIRPPMHEKSMSDQGPSDRQRRRLSEPVHQHPSSPSSYSKKNRPSSIYSIRRPRMRLESPGVVACMHASHVAGSNAGLQESPMFKSAEILGQIILTEKRQKMEEWMEGVSAAGATQQQPVHTAVSFGEPRKDADNMSIRSKASRRRVRGVAKQVGATDAAGDYDDREKAVGVDQTASTTKAKSGSPSDLQTVQVEVGAIAIAGNTSNPNHQDSSQVTGDTTPTGSTPQNRPLELSKSALEEIRKDKKRRSVRSKQSVRASILSLGARDRRFPSETSTASEAFSDRRHNIEQSPYQLLHTLSTDLHERLTRSDPRELNRRLKRTFDIQALSQMSNSVIENVLTDIGTLGERFRWLEAHSATDPTQALYEHPSKTSPLSGELSTESDMDEDDDSDDESEFSLDEEQDPQWSFKATEFFPFTHTVQELLSENGKLRMTVNELQLSIVQKVEQDRIKAEKDFLQDHLEEGDHDSDDQTTIDGRSDFMARKPTQNRNASGKADRPRILGSSSGVSGIFSKLFRGSSQSSSHANTRTQGATQRPAAASPGPTDKPMSQSKSAAEMSRILAESSRTSAPKTPARSTTTDGTRISGTSAILVPGSRMSATTSLAAMAATSPARSSTIYVSEGLATASTTLTTATLTRAKTVNTGFNPDTRHGLVIPHSQRPLSSAVISAQGVLSQSFPYSRSFDNQHSEDEAGVTSRGLHFEDERASHRLASVDEIPDEDPGSISDVSRATRQDRHSLLKKTPRSIDVTTRTGSLALSVVTKQDVFQDHWTTSTPSSFSATMSTAPSKGISDRRAIDDSPAGGVAASIDPYKGGLSASLSSNSTVSETMSHVTSRLVSRPTTLITQSALTVAKPSTSTAPSPKDITSWQDIRRFPGDPGHDTVLEEQESGLNQNESTQSRARFGLGTRIADDATLGVEQSGLHKKRATTSFHTEAVQEGTMSQSRTGGREPGLSFLRGDVQASSILGSILQSQSQSQSRSQSPARPQSPAATPSVRRSTSKPNLKGKGPASENPSSNNSSKVNLGISTDYIENDYESTSSQADYYRGEMDFASVQGGPSKPSLMTISALQRGTPARSDTLLPASASTAVTSTAVAYVVATPAHGPDDESSSRPIFDRGLVMASQKRILAGIPSQGKVFVPQARPTRARALSVDSAQSAEPFKSNEIMDLWRAGADASRDIWRGLIKKVDGRDS